MGDPFFPSIFCVMRLMCRLADRQRKQIRSSAGDFPAFYVAVRNTAPGALLPNTAIQLEDVGAGDNPAQIGRFRDQ